MIKNLPKFLIDFYAKGNDGRVVSHKEVSNLTIDQLDKLIDMELCGQNRKSVLMQLHRRYTRLRADKERRDLNHRKEAWRHQWSGA